MVPQAFDIGGTVSAPARGSPAEPHLARRSPQWLIMLIVAGCCGSIWLGSPSVSAQGRQSAITISVASQLWLKPGEETPFEIRLIPVDAVPPQSVIVIRGVPPGMRFSEGRAFADRVWFLPAARLPNLKLQAPSDASSGGLMTISLTSLDGVAIAQAKVTVLSVPKAKETIGTTAALPAEQEKSVGSPPWAKEQDAVPAPKELENRVDLVLLLEKGRESMRQGNILHARQFYERAANKGLAEAALALAATYDPRELPRMREVAGVTPDAALARKWYERARELGSPDAAARLSGLDRR
jgi:hypothetical protein